MTSKHRARRAQHKPAPPEAEHVPRSALSNLWEWRAHNSHLFPSDTSLRWHLRQHRDEYIASGALFEIAGRLACDPPKMEEALRKIGARVAAERDTTPAVSATEHARRDERIATRDSTSTKTKAAP